MGFAKRKKRKVKGVLFFVAIFAITATLVTVAYQLLQWQLDTIKTDYEAQIQALEFQTYLNQKDIYVPTRFIPAGAVIEEEMVEKRTIISEVGSELYFQEADFGKCALIPLGPNEPIMLATVTLEQLADDVRQQEFTAFLLPTALSENEFVDLRLALPNGEDYIILSKKKVRDVNLETNTLWLWLSEMEILQMSSAIVDAYLHQGSHIYTTIYVAPVMQAAAIPTYPVNTDVLTMIHENPNIVKTAKEALTADARLLLEERLMGLNPNIESLMASELAESPVTIDEAPIPVQAEVVQLVQETQEEDAYDNFFD